MNITQANQEKNLSCVNLGNVQYFNVLFISCDVQIANSFEVRFS